LEYDVRVIQSKEAYYLLLNVHYAKRIPSISYAYGLFRDGRMVGVVTYGTPSSSPLRNGIAGKENASKVLELNRLCLEDNIQNEASILVGRSLKLLPKPRIIVSYADTAQGHLGTVYQACNFTYTGLSAKRTDWKLKGMEHLHGATIADMSRGQTNRAQWMRDKFGDDFYLLERSRKHRYLYITGNKYERRDLTSQILYKQEPFPKPDGSKTVKDMNDKYDQEA
jgi:hypothetical protein